MFALSRLSGYQNDSEKMLIDTLLSNLIPVITYQFGIFSRQTNNMANMLHERSLRLVLKNYKSNLDIQLIQPIEICNQSSMKITK